MNTQPKAENFPEPEELLAQAIFSALKQSDPAAFISGAPDTHRTVIDGTFNLEAVSKMVLWEMRATLELR